MLYSVRRIFIMSVLREGDRQYNNIYFTLSDSANVFG